MRRAIWKPKALPGPGSGPSGPSGVPSGPSSLGMKEAPHSRGDELELEHVARGEGGVSVRASVRAMLESVPLMFLNLDNPNLLALSYTGGDSNHPSHGSENFNHPNHPNHPAYPKRSEAWELPSRFLSLQEWTTNNLHSPNNPNNPNKPNKPNKRNKRNKRNGPDGAAEAGLERLACMFRDPHMKTKMRDAMNRSQTNFPN